MSQLRSNLLGLLLVGALLYVAIASPGRYLNSVYAANDSLHEIRGTVEAVSPKDSPPIIVVKSLHGSKEEIVVGAKCWHFWAPMAQGKPPPCAF